ncbi:hypothetical protein [Roseomonas sp. WA12]
MQPNAEAPLPMTLPPQGSDWRQTLWSVLGTLMFGAILVAIAIYTVPNLVSDWRIRDTAQPVAGGRVTEGSCSSRLMINVCDATLSVQTKSGIVSRDVNYIFADLHSGSYSVAVVADPAHPELPTTDMALQKLWNRTITLLIGGGLLLALTVAPVVILIRRFFGRASQAG